MQKIGKVLLKVRLLSTIPPFATPERIVYQRVGAFRGGLVGFTIGLSTASALCYVYLLEEYNNSSNSLLTSIEDLQKTTLKLKDYTLKIDRVQEQLKEWELKIVTKDELKNSKLEVLKLIDDVVIEGLETKTALYELSQKK